MEFTDLRGANLRDADIREGSFREAFYDRTTVWPAGLDAVSTGAICVGPSTWFRGGSSGDPRRGLDGRGADLRRAYLGPGLPITDLRQSNVAGADLSEADLGHARLEGARYDRRTRWPAGFRPEEHGVRLME